MNDINREKMTCECTNPSVFDEYVERHGTGCVKYDLCGTSDVPADVLPMWIADMDFKTPACVNYALERLVGHGLYGYPLATQSYKNAACDWFSRRYGWKPEPEWMLRTPGIVFALNAAIRAFTAPDDAVIINTPVYGPFARSIRSNGRRLVTSSLMDTAAGWRIDFVDFERKIIENKVKLFILCNPHNPVGRVWRREELEILSKICLENGVTVVSDEIHCDFCYNGSSYTPYASVSEAAAQSCISCTAPSKTFNIAGLQASNIFVKNEKLRSMLESELEKTGIHELNSAALVAAQAAYEGGEQWLDELIKYLHGNALYVKSFIDSNIPEIKMHMPEGTYLAWLDCRALGISDEDMKEKLLNVGKLWLGAGTDYGDEGSGFLRMNFAAPRSVVEEGMRRFERFVRAIPHSCTQQIGTEE